MQSCHRCAQYFKDQRVKVEFKNASQISGWLPCCRRHVWGEVAKKLRLGGAGGGGILDAEVVLGAGNELGGVCEGEGAKGRASTLDMEILHIFS